MDVLPEQQRPHSFDPDFWDVWTLKAERKIDWASVAKDWTGEKRTDEQPADLHEASEEPPDGESD
jgi:hypothetical protein